MKKLALALVCFASVAFFASCQQEITNPEPSISLITDDGFVKNGDVIDVEQVFVYGFQMASNSQTKKELKQLSIATSFIDIEGNESTPEEEIISLAGKTEYRFVDTVYYEITRELVGTIKTVATVTDVDGKINTTTLTLSLNQPALPLITRTFEWSRWGNDIQGLDEFGLSWKGNYPKDTYAKLVPQDGVKLFIFETNDWDEVTTDVEKTAFFNKAIETQQTADEYFEINVTQMEMTYNHVIGTVMPDGTCHLIKVIKSHSEYVAPTGTKTTITGEAK